MIHLPKIHDWAFCVADLGPKKVWGDQVAPNMRHVEKFAHSRNLPLAHLPADFGAPSSSRPAKVFKFNVTSGRALSRRHNDCSHFMRWKARGQG